MAGFQPPINGRFWVPTEGEETTNPNGNARVNVAVVEGMHATSRIGARLGEPVNATNYGLEAIKQHQSFKRFSRMLLKIRSYVS